MRYQACLGVCPPPLRNGLTNQPDEAVWAISAQYVASIPSAKAAHRKTALATPDPGVLWRWTPQPASVGRGGGLCQLGPPHHLQHSQSQPRELMLRQPHQRLRLAGSIASCDADIALKDLFVMRLPHHQSAPIAMFTTALMRLPQSAISDVAQFAPVQRRMMRLSHRTKKFWCDFHNKKGKPLSRHHH